MKSSQGYVYRKNKKLPREVKIHPREKDGQEGQGWLKDYWQILNTKERNAPEHVCV